MQDAQAAVRLYTMVRTEWEKNLEAKAMRKRTNKEKKPGSATASAGKNTATSSLRRTQNSHPKETAGFNRPVYVDSDNDS